MNHCCDEMKGRESTPLRHLLTTFLRINHLMVPNMEVDCKS